MDAAIFGLIVADLIASPMRLNPPLEPGGLDLIDSITLTTGGNVCNTGVAMAKLGMDVAAAGLVGNDVLGAAVRESLNKAGVNTAHVLSTDKAQTSASVVAVTKGGERAFFHTPGATPLLDDVVFRRFFPLFKSCAFVQIGYFGLLPALTPSLPNALRDLRAAAPNTKIALDTVNVPLPTEQLPPILPHLDIFCPSRTEAAALTKESTPQAMVASFRRQMPRGLIGIKLDAEGCYLDDGGQSLFIPACKIDCVDTTGAGDTWFGALLTALHHKMPLKQAGQFANRAAADCCTALGASAGVRTFADTLSRL
jgi:sugar/nucleoside kinase (ribokinase family)